MNTNPITWEVVEYVGNSTAPKSILRLHDGEVFSLGDYVTNGTQMKGNIEKFDFSFRGNDVFVYTDWSGIGMNLDSLIHTQPLPCKFQIGKTVLLNVGEQLLKATVLVVHFSTSKIKYDLEVKIKEMGLNRFYNIDESLLSYPIY